MESNILSNLKELSTELAAQPDTWKQMTILEAVTTIEALQQENEQLQGRNTTYVNENANQAKEIERLQDENISIKNWNACEAEQFSELLESDKRRIELEEEVEQLQAQAARMIELPCKVGQIVYADCCGDIIGWEIYEIELSSNAPNKYYTCGDDDGYAADEMYFEEDDIGKTVFLTREAAEKAIAEVGDN